MTTNSIPTRALAALLALLCTPLLFCETAHRSYAQAPRVGFTDHAVIVLNMPEFADVQRKLQVAADSSQQEIRLLAQEWESLFTQFEAQASVLSDESREEQEQELIALQQQIRQGDERRRQMLAERERQLMLPILQKVQSAIDAVADEKQLDIVLRSHIGEQPLLLYANDRTVTNITLDVARRLGLNVDEALSREGSD